jgi:hypothetical protein
MKCIQDVKFDIIDKIREDLIKGGLFSTGPTIDNVIAKVSKEEVEPVVKELNHMYKESLVTLQVSNDQISLAINPSDELAQKYLNQYKQIKIDPENVPFSEEQTERGYILDNTGPNTAQNLSPLEEEETVGVFEQFIRHKQRLQTFLEQRLADIQKELKNPKTTQARRVELNNLRLSIKHKLEGDSAKGITGLIGEISDLKKNANIDAVGYYVEKDLARLKELTKSNNPLDIKEARTIIDFYDAAGTFQSDRENPFFPQNQMFFFDENDKQTPDYKLGEETMNQFKQWRDIAMGFAPAIDLKAKEVTVSNFNSNKGVQSVYEGKEFNFDEIVHTKEGLKDVDWVSAWAMDVTQSIFSKSAQLAQVMHSILVDAIEKHENFSRDYAKRIEEITPKVNKVLAEISNGKYKLKAFGILGINGVTYDLFLDTTKNGMQTGTLVQRFTKEFVDSQVDQSNQMKQDFEHARTSDDTVKANLYNTAFEKNKQWKRANTIMMNPALIDEIISDPEYAEFKKDGVTEDQKKEHKEQLVKLLGERGYKEEIQRQKELLTRFLADRASYTNAQMVAEGVNSEDKLSAHSKFIIKQWNLQHNPTYGVQDYFAAGGLFVDNRKVNTYMDYNNTIPRANKTKITAVNGQLQFEDTNQSTGYYNDKFKTIDSDETLREFYDLVKEGIEKIIESAPYELQKSLPAMTLPTLMKSTTEFLMDNHNGTLKMLSSAWRRLWDRIRLSFGLIQQSEVSYAVKDPITGKYNYKVNDSFLQGNQRAVKERSIIEKSKFIQAYNLGRTKGRLESINRFSIVPLNEMNPSALAHLAQLLHVDISMSEIQAGKIDKIRNIIGESVSIGKIIRDYSVHSVVQSQSFDLPKLMKHFTNLAAAYAARTETLPMMEIMKAHYEGIKNPKTTNIGKPILNMVENAIASEGDRKRAIQQMEDWFQRVMLNNYGLKHAGVFGFKTKTEKDDNTGKVSTKIPLIGEHIYSNEEKQKIKEIDELLSKGGLSDAEAGKLQDIKKGFGKVRTATAFVTNFLNLIRGLRLGWNLSSGITNFAEGYTSNMILAAGGEYFNPEEIYYAYSVIRGSWVKNLTFGKRVSRAANKARILMDRFNVLMDSKNELQKATLKTNLSKLEALNPYEINARVEYLNQAPVMIAMLRSTIIKDKNGKEASVWNALGDDGNLIEDFRTEENINNWEKLINKDYLAFKNKLNQAIVVGHGNYDDLRGMMAKSGLTGKALMMFKTWLPMQIYWRFGEEQVNLKTGKTVKGRYRSFTPGSAATFAAGVGFAAFGPVGIALGGLGYAAGKFFGVETELGALRELVTVNKLLFKKAIGMPVNILAGRNLVKSNDDFSDWVGKGKFTALDARNLRGNMAELSIMMTTLALTLLIKSLFWHDDDDKDSAERQFHNVAVNKLMQLSSQAMMYVNPSETWKNVFGDIGVLKFLTDCGTELKHLEELMTGTDPGGTKTWRQTKKLFLPGLFKDLNLKLGFGTQMEKQFTPSPFDDWFKSEEVVTAKKEKLERQNLNEKLKEMGYKDQKQRLQIINMEMPTTKQLNKKGYTREEWEEENRDWERPEPLVPEAEEQEQQ